MNPEHIRKIVEEGKEAFSDNMSLFPGSSNELRSKLLGVHGEDMDIFTAIKTVFKGTKDGYNNAIKRFGSMQQNA